jgi:hypothetical protein
MVPSAQWSPAQGKAPRGAAQPHRGAALGKAPLWGNFPHKPAVIAEDLWYNLQGKE